jgi:hypothetical protein
VAKVKGKGKPEYSDDQKEAILKEYCRLTDNGKKGKNKAVSDIRKELAPQITYVTLEAWAEEKDPDWKSRSGRKKKDLEEVKKASVTKDILDQLKSTIRTEVIDEIIDKLQKLK